MTLPITTRRTFAGVRRPAGHARAPRVRAVGAAFAAAAIFLLAAVPTGQAQEPPKRFAFVSPQYIFTAEVSNAHEFIVNYINLSDFVIVLQPSEFIYKGASGQFYIGQVFDLPTKGTKGENYRYSASLLLTSRTFKGLNVLGAFRELDQIEELSMRVGSKRYYYQPLEKARFDELTAKIEDLDLESSNLQAAMRNLNMAELGRVRSADGSSDWDQDWQGLLLPEGLNPPRIVERPEVTPTEQARKTNTYGAVKLSAIITRDGTIQNLSVVKGLGRGLDERAIEAVKTSWVFLPATKNGEVVETSIKFDVAFPPPRK